MEKTFKHGHALLIGVDKHKDPQYNLPTIKKDINALYNVLLNPELCAYEEDNILKITGEDATKQKILDGLDWLKNKVKSDQGNSTAIIYYSGHGYRDEKNNNEYYLAPYDGDTRQTFIKDDVFSEKVNEIDPERLLIILDSCYSGESDVKDFMPIDEDSRRTGLVESPMNPEKFILNSDSVVSNIDNPESDTKSFNPLQVGKGRASLFASRGEELSHLRKDRKMSVFTYHLIEALSGKATSSSEVKEVLVTDVMSYVARQVPLTTKKDYKKNQNPVFQLSGASFPIALLLGGKGIEPGTKTTEVVAEVINLNALEEAYFQADYITMVEILDSYYDKNPDYQYAQLKQTLNHNLRNGTVPPPMINQALKILINDLKRKLKS